MNMEDFDYDMLDDYDMDPSYDAANVWYKDDPEHEEDPGVSASELVNLCLLPTIQDGLYHSLNLLVWCLIFRLATQTFKISPVFYHALSATTGLLALHHFFQSMTYYILTFCIASYIVLFIVTRLCAKRRGIISSVICISLLIACELFLVKKVDWHKIRGAQMVAGMKVMSVAFDLDIGALQTLPSMVEFAGYIFSVGTCVFGPWVPYREYIAIYKTPVWNVMWAKRILISSLLAILFLTLSTCWIHWLIAENSWRWWLAYREAVSFRCSHYFISFLSEASAIMAGYGVQEDSNWSLPISRPQYIEIPRSLVQVVVSWNIPLHYFLKNYVFRTTKHLGSFVSILATYAVSSILHGLNFQLAAVLLSLGLYTYVEYILRRKLATIFSACILVRPCRRECTHTNKGNKLIVTLTNIGFGLLAFFHLMYLGVMFDSSNATLQEEGYSYQHAIEKWRSLNFISHWIALLTFIFYILI